MNKVYLFFISLILLGGTLKGFSQEKVLYKEVDSTLLYLTVYTPKAIDKTKNNPAMIFFFGGGWNNGSTKQFKRHAEYFVQRGLVCFLVDYRVASRNKTTPFEALKDAKSAMRYIKAHAQNFNIDPDKLIVSGGSAGGYLAAATASITEYNESSDDLSISTIPNALVLFNPVIDNGPGGYAYNRIGEDYKDFSPLHNLKNNFFSWNRRSFNTCRNC